MSTLFHFATPVQISPTFGRGILPDPTLISAGLAKVRAEIAASPADLPKQAGHSITDAAWHAGFVARYESSYAEDVRPIGLDGPELEAWIEGASWALEQQEADMAACWDMDSPENDDAESEERYFDTFAMCGERD